MCMPKHKQWLPPGSGKATFVHFLIFRLFDCEHVITFVKIKTKLSERNKTNEPQALTPNISFSTIFIPESTNSCFIFHNYKAT